MALDPWYPRDALGFKKLNRGEVFLCPVRRADADNRRDLERERQEIQDWFQKMRSEQGVEPELAAYSHGDGAAHYYWVWEPWTPSRWGHYCEANGPWEPGYVPPEYGSAHRGRGWQYPLVAVINGEPSASDEATLRRNKVPYINLLEYNEQTPIPDPDPVPSIEGYIRMLEYAWGALEEERKWLRVSGRLELLKDAVIKLLRGE